MSLELLDDRRARLYVDLSDALDVEGIIADLTAARAAWVRDEAAALRRALADEGERFADDERTPAEMDEAIERRAIGESFAAEAEQWAALDPAADQVQANDPTEGDDA